MKKIIILLLIIIPSLAFSQKRVAPTWLNGDSSVMATRARVMKSIDSLAAIGGGGTNNANVGSGFRILKPGTQEIKTLFNGYAVAIDSSSNTNGITLKADTANVSTRAYRQKGVDSLVSLLGSYVPTSRTISATTPLSGGGDLSANRTLTIADAVANGSTKGAASFNDYGFNSSSGNISIDTAQIATLANAQKKIDSIAGVSSYINIVKRTGFDSLAYLNNSTGVLNIKAIAFGGTGFTWTPTITDTTLSQALSIDNSSITKAKIENVAVGRVLGNNTTAATAPVETGVWMSLFTGSASGSATIDIDLTNYYTVYDEIKITFWDIRPSTDNVSLWMRVSTNGSTYDAGATDYKYQLTYSAGAAAGGIQSTGAAQILLANNVDNTSTNMNQLEVVLRKPAQTTLKPSYPIRFDYIGDSGTVFVQTMNIGLRDGAQDTQAVRFLTSSGNISGSYSVTGLKY